MNDIEPPVSLEALDPARGEPQFWGRLEGRILASAESELRRRRAAAASLGEAFLAWGRLVLPVAAAAVTAALLLLGPTAGEEPPELAGLEEWLRVRPGEEEPLPTFLHLDAEVDRDMVLLAMEEF